MLVLAANVLAVLAVLIGLTLIVRAVLLRTGHARSDDRVNLSFKSSAWLAVVCFLYAAGGLAVVYISPLGSVFVTIASLLFLIDRISAWSHTRRSNDQRADHLGDGQHEASNTSER